MAILTLDMKRVIAEQKLGFVATVGADGTPNLSPKGTMRVLDDGHIGFADIRSPGTIANLAHNPVMEIVFVDPIGRKGYRFKGTARVVGRHEPEFATLVRDHFSHFSLAERFRAIVVLEVARAIPVISPAYDMGAAESDLRHEWLAYFASIQPKD